MNCISIAISPTGAQAAIKRVIEYFYPGEGGKIWVDIFVDNPGLTELALKVLHAGSLAAHDVTNDSWVCGRAEKDHCAGALTKRIVELHDEEFYPIKVDRQRHSVWLDQDEYRTWKGNIERIIGDDSDADAPFTLWEVEPFASGKSILRLCLEMQNVTYQNRFANKASFFLYGEAIVLCNIENGDLPSCREVNSDRYSRYKCEFDSFKLAHRTPEAFEYLIVSPEGTDLLWDALSLSPLLSPKFIASDELSRTTRWFVTDAADSRELRADVLEIAKREQVSSSSAGRELAISSSNI